MGIVIRQSIKGTIVNYAGTFIGFFTTFFVLTRFLSAEEIGLTRVLLDAATLFVALAQLGTSSSAIRYYPYFKDEKTNDHGFFFWTLIVPFVGFAIFSTLFVLFKVPISSLFADKSPLFVEYYHFVLPLSFFMLYQAIFEVNANVLMRIVVPRFVREVVIRILTLGAYLLYAFQVLSFDGFVLAFCSVYAVATVCNIFYLFSLKHISFKPDIAFLTPQLIRSYLLYAFFLIAAALVGAITPAINTFFISAKMGLTFTGVYAIASYMANFIEIPYRSLGAISQPQLSECMKNNDYQGAHKLCQQVSLHQFIAGTFIFFAIWVNIDLIFDFLPNGEQYATGKWVVFYLGLAKLINSSLSIGISVLNYSKRYYLTLLFTLMLTAVAIALNNALIPRLGMNGAALASLLAYVAYYFVALLIIRWRIGIGIFSAAQAKIILVTFSLFALNYGWNVSITPWTLQLPLSDLLTNLINAILRTGLLSMLGVWVVYKWRISTHINHLIILTLQKCRLKK